LGRIESGRSLGRVNLSLHKRTARRLHPPSGSRRPRVMTTQPPDSNVPPEQPRSKLTDDDADKLRLAWLEIESAWSILRMIREVNLRNSVVNALVAYTVLAFASLQQLDSAANQMFEVLAMLGVPI